MTCRLLFCFPLILLSMLAACQTKEQHINSGSDQADVGICVTLAENSYRRFADGGGVPFPKEIYDCFYEAKKLRRACHKELTRVGSKTPLCIMSILTLYRENFVDYDNREIGQFYSAYPLYGINQDGYCSDFNEDCRLLLDQIVYLSAEDYSQNKHPKFALHWQFIDPILSGLGGDHVPSKFACKLVKRLDGYLPDLAPSNSVFFPARRIANLKYCLEKSDE